MKQVTLKRVVELLKNADNVLILAHAHPDGDTLGSTFALCGGLQNAGKNAKVLCSDSIPAKFKYIVESVKQQDFIPEFVVSVDIADRKLLGKPLNQTWGDKVDLSIDHHANNVPFADETWVSKEAAAAGEMIFDVLHRLDYEVTPQIADCLFTAISTDTGCFRYSNVTARTHEIAGKVMETGARASKINHIHFETKTKTLMALEQRALNSLEFFFDEKCALICLTLKDFEESGSYDDEIGAIVAIPRQIEGVLIGVTIREKENNVFKISTRSHAPVNAAKICGRVGGGGHDRAAGCQLVGTLDEVKKEFLGHVKSVLLESGV